ncbi:MAG: twin-arginine translocation signal domain-containing protein, partial [Planctomycetia bacterium]|nr:twin-arginine translocation signal domain-containing protein [Planctomycetia bacterium]
MNMNRRQILTGTAALAATAAVPVVLSAQESGKESSMSLKGNIRHAFSRWCYGKYSLDELCQFCVRLGIPGIDLLGVGDFPTLKKYGLICPMVSPPAPASISYGWNRVEHHDQLVEVFEKVIPQVAEAGFPNLICMSGNREGLDDDTGVENCVKGLRRILP